MAAPAAAIDRAAISAEKASPPPSPEAEREAQAELRWKPVGALACELTVDLPLPDFKIADLLKLRQGSVVGARLRVGHDVPLRLNGGLIGWIEFELVGEHLAVRLTELA